MPTGFALMRPDDLVAVPLSASVPEWTLAVADEPSPAASAFLAQLLDVAGLPLEIDLPGRRRRLRGVSL
ncbi:hypothetical protein [Marisediminicola antarctica]|uniref:Uncharacterized protein n=1 Tax=Marisediminicola antarctica TaxID=674079 RepID=A0A7L5ALZ6_9MICO|nr:hypothetical protein [Marisediminicola antarctica]QHO70334.1 hypothetical protein BHD05_12435 [Marisediminicola antarctica]